MTEKTPSSELIVSILPYIEKLLADAPKFGTVGLDLTLHAGELVHVNMNTGISIKPSPGS